MSENANAPTTRDLIIEAIAAASMPSSVKKKAKKFKNVSIQDSDGEKIMLPKGMDEDRAILELERQKKEKNTLVDVSEEFAALPLDGAYNLAQVIKERFGFSVSMTIPGSMFTGPSSVQRILFPISAREKGVALWGRFGVPALPGGFIQTSLGKGDGGVPKFILLGKVRNRDKAAFEGLARDLRTRMETKSIYKGKAIQMQFPDDPDDPWKFDPTLAPTFIDTSTIDVDQIVFSKPIEEAIERNLFSLIKNTTTCRALGIPMKRGVLLAGQYGVGKTLLARIVAALCERNGWTFVQGKRIDQIVPGLQFAKMFQPSVYFDEDIDAAMEGSERNITVNDILNTLDGVISKDSEIITILTTNHPEKINPAMLRQGRLDFKMLIEPPDAEAVARLVRKYANGGLDFEATLVEVGKLMAGKNAAAIREVVERAKLEVVRRFGSDATENMKLTDADLAAAARDVIAEDSLCKTKDVDRRDPQIQAADLIAQALLNAAKEAMKGFLEPKPENEPRPIN